MAELPLGLWITFAALLGIVIGSFLNVVILRLPARLDALWLKDARELLNIEVPGNNTLPPGIVREPSRCPQCLHRLAITDNIPIVSWLSLRGRCRYCKAPISWQYPAVEALCGILSAVTIWKFGPTWQAIPALFFTWALIALSGIDIKTQLLPDQITLPLLWLGLVLSLSAATVTPAYAIVGAAIGYGSLWAVYWAFRLITGKEGMGYGDFKLLAAMGAWMGPVAILPIVLLSSLLGALAGGVLIATGRHARDLPIPFGPYIAAAGWVWLVAGQNLLEWYDRIALTPR